MLPAATVSFSQKTVTFPDEDFPTGIVADLNNDGREDLISMIGDIQTGGTGVFVVRLSNGDGTYGSPKQYVLPNNSAGFGIVIGDFNNDGSADIAFGGGNDALGDVIFMYLNDGKGNFTLHGTIPTPGGGVPTAAAADFNHDRLMDLAYIANGQLHILFGDGKAGFTQGPVTPVNSDGEPLLIGDYDGDGMADIAWGDYVNYTTATVLYGDNTGHFVPKYVTASEKVIFTTGDVNSDGRTDLIGIPGLEKHIDIFYGNAARTFANHTTVPLKGCATNAASTVDLDGNGINDLVVQESNCSTTGGGPFSNTVGLLTRNSNASYNPEQTIYTANTQYGGIAYGPTVLRADRNSKPDIAVGVCADDECLGTNFQILLNTTSGGFPTCAPPNAFEGINVCSPTGSPTSPVAFHVGAAGQVPMRKVEVWVDGTKEVEQLDGFSHYSFLDKSISLTPGSHKVTIFAAGWDNWLEEKTYTLSVK
jgi:hypothetical protein